MTRFKIPRSPKAVTDQLGEIGELLTATEWKRAALLASVVRLPGSGGDRSGGQTRVTAFETAAEFAARGITGLTHQATVRLYVQRWLDANDGEYPTLGATIVLPEDDWPPTRTGTDGYESEDGVRRTLDRIVERHGPEVVAAAVVDNPRLDTEVNRTRLDRYVPMQEREAMAQEGRQMAGRLEHTIRDGKAEASDVLPHDAYYGLLAAEDKLRESIRKSEQYPHRSPQQQRDIAASVARIRGMVELIERPESVWSDTDREFLASLEGGVR